MITKNNKLNSYFRLILLMSIITIGWQKSSIAEKNTLSEIVSSEKFLQQTAEKMNQRLPMMVDNDTRWDTSFAGPGKSLNYNYTLVNYSAADIDGYLFAQNISLMIKDKICNQPTTVIFPQEGILLNFNYYDNSRSLIARVQVQPSDCGY